MATYTKNLLADRLFEIANIMLDGNNTIDAMTADQRRAVCDGIGRLLVVLNAEPLPATTEEAV